MSTNKIANAADGLYDQHLSGTIFHGYFRGKPANDRQILFERMYMRLLTELSANRFKWIGLPKEIPVRFVEMNMFRSAFQLFYHDGRIDKYVVARAARSGNIDMYDDPVSWNTAARNYPNVEVSALKSLPIKNTSFVIGQGVPIWANYMRVPDMDIVMTYSYRLAILDRTIEINSENARQNKVIPTTRRLQMTHSNIAREVANGNNTIEVKASLADLEFIKAIDLAIDSHLLDSLQTLRAKTWSECMGLLGIDNANQEKKERLVEAEVGANDDQSSLMRYVNLNARREACEKINRIYGLNVWVDYNTEIDKLIGLPEYARVALEEAGFTVKDETIEEDDNSQNEVDDNE